MKNITVITALLLLPLAGTLCAQTQKIKNAEGQWLVVNITPEQAREKALEEAKKDALRKAGVSERIKSSNTVSVVAGNRESSELFSMFSNIEMEGGVTEWTFKKDAIEINSIDGQPYWNVIIDATVKKYSTMPDPEFKIDVAGLRSNGYRNGEEITFSVTPNKDGYLKIFLFENVDDASQLFPNEFEQNSKLQEKKTVIFSKDAIGFGFDAVKTSAEKHEHNVLLFVYTKGDIPFSGTATRKNILVWLNKIERDQREIVMETIVISG
jgi:hypothetical protein